MISPALSSPVLFHREDGRAAGWAVSQAPVSYPDAVSVMGDRVAAIAQGCAGELVWLLEHPPLYSGGVSARPQDLLQPGRFPVFQTSRGGQYTYHGPGQRVAYVMLDLRARRRDVAGFVRSLEAWIVDALDRFNVRGEARPGRVGVWVENRDAEREEKIAAIGVRLRRWVSFHGISLNVEPDLSHFEGIVPCGLAGWDVTSLARLGCPVTLADVDEALLASFRKTFGAAEVATSPL